MSGWYDDHLIAVAHRQAKKMQAGEDEAAIRKFLLWGGWTTAETDRIMRIAKRGF